MPSPTERSTSIRPERRGRFSSGVDPGYLERVRATIVDAAAEALAGLKPASIRVESAS